MKELIESISVSIITGVISGILSGLLILFYSLDLEKKRRIIEYAEDTYKHALLVTEKADSYSKNNDIENLNIFLNNSVNRNFFGDIVDKSKASQELQESIKACNIGIQEIAEAHKKSNNLQVECTNMQQHLINIWNAITLYKQNEYNRIRKHINITKNVIVIIIIILLIA